MVSSLGFVTEMKTAPGRFRGLAVLIIFGFCCCNAAGFIYQGRLTDGPAPATGNYDFQFTLYDAAEGGNLVGETVSHPNTAVSEGLFTAALDFASSSFNGAACWLEIAVRTNGAGDFSTLSPRVEITPTPYALMALNVASNGLAGSYGEPVTFNNSANAFVGAFAGDGGALTNVDAALWGGLSTADFWQIASDEVAAAAAGATNVYHGGSVTTSNVTTIIPSLTNSFSFLGYGGLQLPSTFWGNTENWRYGIEWWDSGWTNGVAPDDSSSLPQGFITVRKGWGGYRYDNPTLHIATPGDIRIEPSYSGTNYGYGYMTLGNEDQANRMVINYLNPSIWIGGGGGVVTNWKTGYGLSLDFPAQTASNSVTLWANPAIQGFGGQTNATPLPDGTLAGQLYFWRRAPSPSFANGDLNFSSAVLGGKMTDTGWEFYGDTSATNLYSSTVTAVIGLKSDRIGSVSGGAITVTNSLNLGLADGTARVEFDVANNTNTFAGGVYSPQFRSTTGNAPASSTSPGTQGEIRWDANYIYICTADNTWKRVALATW